MPEPVPALPPMPSGVLKEVGINHYVFFLKLVICNCNHSQFIVRDYMINNLPAGCWTIRDAYLSCCSHTGANRCNAMFDHYIKIKSLYIIKFNHIIHDLEILGVCCGRCYSSSIHAAKDCFRGPTNHTINLGFI